MGASEVLELVARLRPEGTDETVDSLEEVQDTFQETADTAEQSSEDLEGFANRFEGAIGVAAGALAIGAAGLLSTVPIIGEAFAGIGAIVESFGLQLDQLLRDLGAGGVTGALFEFADSIANAEGPLGDFAGVIAGVAAVIGTVAGALAVAIPALNTFVGTSITLSGVLSGVTGAIATVAGAIFSLPAAIIAAVALIAGAIAAYITNFRGFRDKTNQFILDVIGFFANLANSVVGFLQDLFTQGITLGRQFGAILAETLRTGVRLAANAVKSGGNLIIAGFETILNTVKNGVVNGVNTIVQTIANGVNRSIALLNKLEGVDISGVSFGGISGPSDLSFGRLQTRSSQSIIREGQRRLSNRRNRISGQQTQAELISTLKELQRSKEGDTVIQIDGRTIARATGDFRGQSSANRGR